MTSLAEEMARALARVHFSRKQHFGSCTKEERVNYMVERYWRNHLPDAAAALEVAERAQHDLGE